MNVQLSSGAWSIKFGLSIDLYSYFIWALATCIYDKSPMGGGGILNIFLDT